MSIQFQCPKCQHPLSVADTLAGKNAKCPKCAAGLRIPSSNLQPGSSKSKNPPIPSPSLANAMAELTESDYRRASPFESVYVPPKPQPINNDVLRMAASKDGRQATKPKDGLPGVLIFFSIVNLLQGISSLGFAVVLIAAAKVLGDNLQQQVPFLAAGMGIAATLYGILAVVALATGIGLLTKKIWGYAVANATYTFYVLVGIFSIIGMRGDRNQMIYAGIQLVVNILFASYFFRRRCREFYKIKSWQLPLIFSGVGAFIGIVFGAALLALGVFATGTLESPT